MRAAHLASLIDTCVVVDADMTLPMTEAVDVALGAGTLFGRYLIVSLVGAGGLGEVYAAYDPSLDRRVALKVMRPGPDARSDDAVLVREAKALASLSHPNVVTVHDVGQDGGRVFVAMELVEGQDLQRWLEHAPDRSWRALLRVFVDAGKGLSAAHARGILHRDFKPANVLIGENDWVRVSDFGLAALLSEDELTISVEDWSAASLDESVSIRGAMVGTPYYMAPEQIDGHCSIQSDIYTFCLSLHDALYGHRAFDATSLMELAVLKSQGAPAAPANARGVPASVRAAIARGLRHDPSERWPSMKPLLEVLERALQPRAVSSLPWVAGLGGIVAAAISLAPEATDPCTTELDAVGQMWTPERSAKISTGFEQSASPLAKRTVDRVLPRLDGFGETWTEARVHVCRATQRGEQSTSSLDQRMTCLKRQLFEFDAVAALYEQPTPEVIRRSDRLLQTLPDPRECETYEPTNEDPPSAELELARRELAHVRALVAAGDVDAAMARSEALLDHASSLRAPRFHARTSYARGTALELAGLQERATEQLEETAYSAIAADDERVLFNAANVLTLLTAEASQHEQSKRWARIAEALLERTGATPDDRNSFLTNRAAAHALRGDHADAEQDIRTALELVAGTHGVRHGSTLRTLGSMLYYQGRMDEAIEAAQQSVDILREALGPDHPRVAFGISNLATLYMMRGDYEHSDPLFVEALEIQERVLGNTSVELGQTLNNIAVSHYQRGHASDALPYFERAQAIREATLAPDDPALLDGATNIAMVIAESGDRPRGLRMLEDIVRQIDANPSVSPSGVAVARLNLANLYGKEGRDDEAEALFLRLIEDDRASETSSPDLVGPTALTSLGVMYKKQRRFEDALLRYEEALAALDGLVSAQHPQRLAVLNNMATLHLEAKQPKLAAEAAQRVLDTPNALPRNVGMAQYSLAIALRALGQRTRALELARP